MKSILHGHKITLLRDRLPCLRSRVRYAHTATQTPRKIMALAIFLPLPTRHFKQNILCIFASMKSKVNMFQENTVIEQIRYSF